jgi:hypothetical protein
MRHEKLSCVAILLLLFFSLGIIIESVAIAAPIGEWGFDESSGNTALDTSGHGKHGTLVGNPTRVDGIRNKALQFSGSSQYVQVPGSLEGLSDWTFTAFVNPTGSGDHRVYMEKSGNDEYLKINITSDNRIKVETRWIIGGSALSWDTYQTYTNKIARNKWNSIVISLRNGDTITCYVDGVQVGTGNLGIGGVLDFPESYGALWEVGPGTHLTRLGKAVGLQPANFNNIYPWSGMTTTTQNGQAVVKIPKFYYKRVFIGNSHIFCISGEPQDGFKLHPAFDRPNGEKPYVLVGANKFGSNSTRAQCRDTAKGYGSGWGLIDLPTWSAIQMLWLVEYADTNSEKYSTDWRGLKGLWTESGQWIDGVNIQDRRVYLSENNVGFKDDVFSGDYKDTGFVLPSNNGFITNWHYSEKYDWSFIPKSTGGSSSTYIPDQVFLNAGNRVLSCGSISTAVYSGLFFWAASYSSSSTYSYHAARALYIP